MKKITPKKGDHQRHIVTISGGVSSAYVAKWVKENIEGDIVYYFNDTGWEHPDLYRFLKDIEKALDIKIHRDSDGRTPEAVFYDERMLGSNRTPNCSKILKATRLQKFAWVGDVLYFGIDTTEIKRAARISMVYRRLGMTTVFPILENPIAKDDIMREVEALGVEIPQLYKDGFSHNNCSGGCVRSGRKQWASLYRKYPRVYADRERVETEFSEYIGRESTFMKNLSLARLREIIDEQGDLDFGEDDFQGECVGICGTMY